MRIIYFIFFILLIVSCSTSKNNVEDTFYQFSQECKQYLQKLELITINLSILKTDNNKLIATLDFINKTDKDIGIPYWYLGKAKTRDGFIDKLANNYFVIKNINNQQAEYIGIMMSALLKDREDLFIIKSGENYKVKVILNDYYKISNDFQRLEIYYEAYEIGKSNFVVVVD